MAADFWSRAPIARWAPTHQDADAQLGKVLLLAVGGLRGPAGEARRPLEQPVELLVVAVPLDAVELVAGFELEVTSEPEVARALHEGRHVDLGELEALWLMSGLRSALANYY